VLKQNPPSKIRGGETGKGPVSTEKSQKGVEEKKAPYPGGEGGGGRHFWGKQPIKWGIKQKNNKKATKLPAPPCVTCLGKTLAFTNGANKTGVRQIKNKPKRKPQRQQKEKTKGVLHVLSPSLGVGQKKNPRCKITTPKKKTYTAKTPLGEKGGWGGKDPPNHPPQKKKKNSHTAPHTPLNMKPSPVNVCVGFGAKPAPPI